MKHLAQLMLVGLITLTSFTTASAQIEKGPIYASVNTTENIKETNIVSAESNTSALTLISNQLSKSLDYPHEALQFRNEISVLVEVQIDRKGAIKKYYVHNTADRALIENIDKALKELDSLPPVVLNGKVQAQSIIIPVTFKN